jgi:hypothetical protein
VKDFDTFLLMFVGLYWTGVLAGEIGVFAGEAFFGAGVLAFDFTDVKDLFLYKAA